MAFLPAEVAYWKGRFDADVEILPSGAPRQRCRKCRGYLWITGKKTHAVDGKFCTLECADWPPEGKAAIDLWCDLRDRHCGCWGSAGRKVMHLSEQAAIEAIQPPRLMYAYACPSSTSYHLATGVPRERKNRRQSGET